MIRRSISGILCIIALSMAVTSCSAAPAKDKKPAAKPLVKPVAALPLPTDWATKTVKNLTLSVPSKWRAPSDAMIQGAWFAGKDENSPNAMISCMWNNIRIKDILSSATVKKQSKIKIDGASATEYQVTVKLSNLEGLIITSDTAETDGTRLMIMAGSLTGEWNQYEPTLRKILDSIKIKKELEQKPPMTTPVRPEVPADAAKPAEPSK